MPNVKTHGNKDTHLSFKLTPHKLLLLLYISGNETKDPSKATLWLGSL